MKAPSWTPVRKGDIYCSPACGAGCKFSDFKKATADAKALCKKLGPGWKPRVWENLMWHFEARRGFMSISPLGDTGKYTSLLGTKEGLGGEVFWFARFAHKDPVKVYKHQIKVAKDFIKRCEAAVNKCLT